MSKKAYYISGGLLLLVIIIIFIVMKRKKKAGNKVTSADGTLVDATEVTAYNQILNTMKPGGSSAPVNGTGVLTPEQTAAMYKAAGLPYTVPGAVANVTNSTTPSSGSNAATGNADTYALWASYMIKQLNDTGNVSIANDLNIQLRLAVNKTPTASATNYVLDETPYYGKIVPALPSSVTGGKGISTQQVFMNAANIMCLVAKNYVQGNTNGQAIGNRQGIINRAMDALRNNATMNNVPQFAPPIIYYYNCALKNQWPVGNGGGDQIPANDAMAIINAVTTAAKIAALFL